MNKRNCAMLAWAALGGGGFPSLAAAQPVEQPGVHHPTSVEALQLATWVTASRDHGKLPFIVIDKGLAEVLIFDAQGLLQGVTPALLGIAHGDDATPGIGDKELSEIGPAEKTTPAGRFLARIGPAKGNQTVLWVDFETSVALHPVVTGNPKERRLQRLESATPKDNRITFGCINVPPAFFSDVVGPLFAKAGGMVYILPESKFLIEVFPAFHMFAPPIARSATRVQDDR
ncbi:MAG TPA: hypothetical protein VFR36_09730 [Sphingomicrobium sp.]|nr:hypothetical protein [Sphingomicrobium sp.]